MKTELTTEQSKHLIELGVPKEKASKVAWEATRDVKGDIIPKKERNHGIMDKPFSLMHVGMQNFSNEDIFTLTDLLEVLPKNLDPNKLIDLHFDWNSYANKNLWMAFYTCKSESKKESKELIDALYKLVIWCIENGHLKFNKSN